MLISTVNAESLFSTRHRYYDFTHEVGFTPHSLSQVLYFTGFTDMRIFPKEPYIHGLKSAVRWFLWKGMKQLIRFYLLVETGSAGHGVYTQVMYAIGVKAKPRVGGRVVKCLCKNSKHRSVSGLCNPDLRKPKALKYRFMNLCEERLRAVLA